MLNIKLNHFTQQPDWLKDNHFLHHGHRAPTKSYAICLKSVFFMHNETLNIWTHLIPCFLFVFFFLKILFSNGLTFTDKFVLGLFLTGALLCHMFSTAFHTFSCHSERVAKFFQKLDYCGIALLITFSFVPWLHYGFSYNEPLYAHSYLAGVVSLATLSIWFSLDDKFGTAAYRPFRALIFALFGLSGAFPALHWLYIHEQQIWANISLKTSFASLLLMGGLYIFGAALYASRIPERYFPGKCDFFLHSHQIFHVFVTMAALVHYYGINVLLDHVKETYESNSIASSDIGYGDSVIKSQLKYENERLRMALAKNSENAKEWAAEVQKLRTKIQTLTSALQESSANKKEWEQQLSILKNKNDKYQLRILELEASNGDSEAGIMFQERLNALSYQLEENQNELKNKELEIEALKKKLDELQQEKNSSKFNNGVGSHDVNKFEVVFTKFGSKVRELGQIHQEFGQLLESK